MIEFTADEITRFFEYLDDLRASGKTNMYGARPYVTEEFDMSGGDAGEVLVAWMRTFSHGLTSKQRAALALAGEP